jgi:hypothetical protein
MSLVPEARDHLETALRLDPFCEITLRLLKTVYADLAEPEKAKVADKAKEIDRLLSDEGEKKKREAEITRRKNNRKDRTDGCR